LSVLAGAYRLDVDEFKYENNRLYFSIKKGTSLVVGTPLTVKLWADSGNNSRRGELAFHAAW
jgi:hypothetical protein